jgi:hypothetical protein
MGPCRCPTQQHPCHIPRQVHVRCVNKRAHSNANVLCTLNNRCVMVAAIMCWMKALCSSVSVYPSIRVKETLQGTTGRLITRWLAFRVPVQTFHSTVANVLGHTPQANLLVFLWTWWHLNHHHVHTWNNAGQNPNVAHQKRNHHGENTGIIATQCLFGPGFLFLVVRLGAPLVLMVVCNKDNLTSVISPRTSHLLGVLMNQ